MEVANSIFYNTFSIKLIEEALFYAKEKLGATEINLGVFTNNEDALKCYEFVGFKTVSIEKGAYKYHQEEWDCAEMIYAK
jgi:ribosomal protein S18 acetylase RimI-like enzyme